MANHVSAASVTSIDTLTLINMNKLHHKDKEIWKEAYDE